MIENFKKRIDDLDYLVNRANFKTSKYDELKRQINAMESTISIKHNETHQKMNEMNQQITYCDQNIKSLYETSAGQSKSIQKLEGDNVQVNTSILNTKTELLQAINEQWKKTLNLNEKVEQKLHEIKEVTDESMQQSQSNTNRINVIENLQDTISRLSTNNDIEIKNIWKQKVDLENYQKEVSRINNQFRSAAFSIETVENMLKNTDRYIDRQIPFKTQFIISETLHAFMDNKSKRRLLEWEDNRFRYLKEYSMDERKVDRMAFMEEWNNLRIKNDEYMRKLQQEQREKDEKKEQEKQKGHQEQKSAQQVEQQPDGNGSNAANNAKPEIMIGGYDIDDDAMNLIQKIEDKLEQVKYEFNLRQKSLAEKSDKMQESMENYFTSLNDSITESLKNRKKDKSDHQREFSQIVTKIEDAINVTNSNKVSLETLGQMVAAFVECFRIQQILNESEESDKKSFGLYGLKETMQGDLGKVDSSPNYQSYNTQLMQQQSNHATTLPDIKDKDGSFVGGGGGVKEATGRVPKNDAVKRIRNLSNSAHAKAKGKGSDINIKVDKKCLSCSGQSSTVLSAFKLACLNYTSSKVEYQNKVLEKSDVLTIRDEILNKIFDKLKSTEPWKNFKITI
eukprot:Mrub_01655.p1 GENE.Mrub_01655~~Mrub_01655.p1  ORF type:complete len:666 (+),score=168.69 Mrub_01655:134-1999(+)